MRGKRSWGRSEWRRLKKALGDGVKTEPKTIKN
jgi:hypothetical protein